MVAVPNVVGDNQAQTLAAFTSAGLYFYTSGPGAGTNLWKRVVSEIPAAGVKVAVGTHISLNVAE
jgi:beta-lactam-binding protein with PASTA domain